MPLKREEHNDSSLLPPLSVVIHAIEQETKPQLDNQGPTAIPLFVPAQVDRKAERKSSVATGASRPLSSKKSQSPAPISFATSGLNSLGDKQARLATDSVASEYGLRGSHKPSETISIPIESSEPKKRTSSKPTAARKKGTAKKAASSASRKRKLDIGTPTSSGTRDTTPASRNSGLGAQGRDSTTPAFESSPGADESEEGDEEGSGPDGDELFCICRKPDDHKYMIACDAGCEDWFHGRCVNISEADGKLIDRYICINCQAKGKGESTWKPMCRRPSCRKPARLTKGMESKYCSHDCGLRFFQDLIVKSSADATQGFKRGKPNNAQVVFDARLGALEPQHLKALVDSVEDSKAFRSLGNGILRPPTATGLNQKFSSMSIPEATESSEASPLTVVEQAQIDNIAAKKEALYIARAVLEDRKRYFTFAKERLAVYATKSGLKAKDICGFDQRLSWSTQRFQRWRNSPAGEAAYTNGNLEPTTNGEDSRTNGDAMDVDGANGDESVSMCLRKRCERHKQWQRHQVEEARFEESGLADQMRQLDRQEREVRERAAMRARREVSGLLETQGTVTEAGS